MFVVKVICLNLILNINDCMVSSLGRENFKLREKSKKMMFIFVRRCIFCGWEYRLSNWGLVSMFVNK